MVMDEVIVIMSMPNILTMPCSGSTIPGNVTASSPASTREVASMPVSANVSTGYAASNKLSAAHAANVRNAHATKVRGAHAAKVSATYPTTAVTSRRLLH
jgi:hypothetical protein